MNRRKNSTALIIVSILSMAIATANAQSDPPADVDAILKRLEKVENELQRLKSQNNADAQDPQQNKVVALLETPFWGAPQYGRNNVPRTFVARMMLLNLTAESVTVKRDQIKLEVDGTSHTLGANTRPAQNFPIQLGNQSRNLSDLKPAESITAPPNGTASTWLVFSNLPAGNQIPKLVLKMQLGEDERVIDINEFSRDLLKLEVERIGPRETLALLTISGTLNTINIDTLVDELETLTVDRVARTVIRWNEGAEPVESRLSSWLQQSTNPTQRSQTSNSPYPVIPSAIAELHLAALPGKRSNTRRSYRPSSSGVHIHNTTHEAVEAALASAYEVLPRDELFEEIQDGHPLTRPAALAIGGGRLEADKLPTILQYADDKDPAMQLAALRALKHFGEPEAIAKLVHYSLKNVSPLSDAAIASLAGSRYSAAHEELLKLMQNEGPESIKKIVAILSQHPRPIWANTIYEFVKDPAERSSVEALTALVRIGHPKLVDVLENSLEHGDGNLQNATLAILNARSDRRSEQIALNYTLKHLQEEPPTSEMYKLLKKTKDQRAVPLMLKHLQDGGRDQTNLINTLADIGDQDVADPLVELYPRLSNRDKAGVLTALQKLKSPKFLELSGPALMSGDSYMIQVAARGLQIDGGPAAVKLLAETLENSGNVQAWSQICNALSTIATLDARRALLKARDSKDKRKSNYAQSALANLMRRSPGYQYVAYGQQSFQNGKWKESVEQYSLAIEIDQELPDAFIGRGSANLELKKFADARKDFEKAFELDPNNSQAVTGMALMHVLEGDYDDGFKLVEKAKERIANDALFAYNSACVYARALQHIKTADDKPENAEKAQKFQDQAISLLKESVQKGFRDMNWMRKDPDLKSLHDVPEFKSIHTPARGNG